MKLSFSTLCCPEWSLEQMVEAAAENGIEGIDFRGIGAEIDITRLPEFNEDLERTLKLMGRHDVQMPCLNTSVTLVSPAPERWQMMLDECQRYARLADRTGTALLRIFGGGVPKDLTRDEARMLARRHLRQLVKICQSHACRIALETHDDWSTAEEVLELIADLDPAEVGILWDIEHPFRKGEPPARTAEGLKGYLCHVHVKDSLRIDGKNQPRLLGEGDLPLEKCLGALKSIEYTGWICLETEKRWRPEDAPEPEQSVPQFSRYMSGGGL